MNKIEAIISLGLVFYIFSIFVFLAAYIYVFHPAIFALIEFVKAI